MAKAAKAVDKQTDLRAQPGAVVTVPSGARCFVTGYKNGKVLVDYESKTLGSDSYPLHLLRLVQEAPKDAGRSLLSDLKPGDRVVWAQFPNAVYEVVKAGKARAIVKLIEEVNPGNKLAPEEKSVPVEELGFSTAQNEGDNPLEFCSEVDVEAHKLPFTYIPAFLAQDEADLLLKHSLELNWQQNEIKMFGKPVVLPRLEAIYGEGDYTYNGLTLKASPWSEAQAIYSLMRSIEEETGYSYQIAIGNQYRDGSDHIGWHSDDSPELGEKPAIASLSLGSTRRFQLRHKVTKEVHTFELNHGDLLVMHPGCQEEWVHRICKTSTVAGVRVNWTFRPRLQSTGAGEVIEAEIVVSRSEQLSQLEAQISDGLAKRQQAEQQIWIAAAQIKSDELWKDAGFPSFEAYCRDRFDWEKSNAYEVAGAGEVVLQLQAAGAEEIPSSVAAVRVLKKVDPATRLQVIQTAKEETGKLTADAIRQAASKLEEPATDPSKLVGFAQVEAEPATEETSTQAEPVTHEIELTAAQKKLLYNLKLIAQGASDQVYNQLCKQIGEENLEFLAEVSEEVNEAIAAILEKNFSR